jgi:hypothetical protein
MKKQITNKRTLKIAVVLFKVKYLNAFVESFKKNVFGNAQQRPSNNSIQYGCHVLLNVFSILKPLSLRKDFNLGKRKMQSRKLGLF